MSKLRKSLISQVIRNFGLEEKFTIAFCQVAEGSIATDRQLKQILTMHMDKIEKDGY